MGFWERFRGKQPPPALEARVTSPPEFGGELRKGKKHGRWAERDETEETRRVEATFTIHKLGTYGWRELVYADGLKHGPFVERHSTGFVRRSGSYAHDLLEGPVVLRTRSGELEAEGAYLAGEREGQWRYWYPDGALEIEAHFVAGKQQGAYTKHHANGRLAEQGTVAGGTRDGAWKEWSAEGQPLVDAAYVAGERDGAWKKWSVAGNLVEEGSYIAGAREGAWKCWTATGTLIEDGNYTAGKRHGAWKLRRADGSICAEGEYAAGVMTGPWRRISVAGVASEPRAVADEAELVLWGELEVATELIAAYAPTPEWIARVKAAFAELAQPWQVTTRTDAYGQTFASVPIGVGWQLRIASGVPEHTAIRDEVWSRIITALEKLPDRAAAVAFVRATGKRFPTFAPREWLTAILEEETDDIRTQLVSRFEPGREFNELRSQRFQRRVPHLEEFSIRECSFPVGFAALFEHGYPELDRLVIVRNSIGVRDAVRDLYGLLARATWPTKLRQLAIVESGPGPSDEQLAELFANPHLGALKLLTLDDCTLGPATARALRDGPVAKTLEFLSLRDSRIDAAALAALAACPTLDELELRDCELGDMTSREAMAIKSPKLRILKLSGTLGVEKHASDDERSGYAVMRRLAVMPALTSVVDLDLSDNDLDGLAARALARSPYLAALKRLDWTGNNERGEEGVEDLCAALPAGVLNTDKPQRKGNVVVLRL